DRLRGEGSTAKLVQTSLSDPLGIDFPTQVIDNLAGRFTWIIGYEKPAHLQGQRHILAAELVDEAAAAETLKTVLETTPTPFEQRHFGNVTYYERSPEALDELPAGGRPEQPFVAIMDGYFFIGGSTQLFERCIAARDGTV